MPTLVENEDYASEPLDLVANTDDGFARQAALSILQEGTHQPTSVVSYDSAGKLLVVCDDTPEPEFIERVKAAGLGCTVLVKRSGTADIALKEGPHNVDLLQAGLAQLDGHLGEFHAMLDHPDGPVDASKPAGLGGRGFDLVLDLSEDKILQRDVLPIGYFAPATDEDLDRALVEIPTIVGEFDKPKFFNLDPDICAHKSRGVSGCTRCLDVCPTQAISSLEESIEVDPYLCQGIGVCTTVCPTGAITYAFPRVSDLLDDMRRVLHRYHDEKGTKPILLFHDDEKGKEWLRGAIVSLPENLIPVEVENVASIGMDTWLSCIAYGAHYVLLLATDDFSTSIVNSIDQEILVAGTILGAMGYPKDRIAILHATENGQVSQLPSDEGGKQVVPPAGFAAFNEKRTTLRLALDHFHEHATKTRKTVPLPEGAAFGRVKVDKQACTLCMSCAAVCPSSALTDGEGLPRLMFLERNCVQCGMCERACPEDAVTTETRFNFDAEERDRAQILYEEEPFNCVKCGTPFSTQSMMTRMRDKLKGHWMYQDEAQMRRLEMCDNCRIEDMYVNSGGIDPYDKPEKPTGSDV